MSQTPSRRQRLLIAKGLPPAHCPNCGVALERVAVVSTHLRRCDRLLAEEAARIDAALASMGAQA